MPSRSPEDVLAKQARQDARRERNRVAAQNSRDRKLQDFQRLADDNTALREEVAELRHRLAAYEGTGSGAGGAGGGGRAGAGNGNGAGAGAGPSNGSGMGSAGKRKRILTKPLHKKVAAARKWEDDEDDEDEDEDELFDLDEAPRSSPRPDDSVFGISRAGSTLTGLKVSFLGGSSIINSSPVGSPRLAAPDTDDDGVSVGSFAAAPQEGQDQILRKIGVVDSALPGPQGRGHRIKRPKVEI